MLTFTKPEEILRLGLDIGSTTVKVVVFDDNQNQILGSWYSRHYADVFQTLYTLISEALLYCGQRRFTVAVTGSAGIGLSQKLGIPFVQEVIAGVESVTTFIPQTNAAIELGGEDAKITFFDGSIDQRMNETCAGGTGAFIDQIAVTLKTDALGVNELASRFQTIYPIAARCGVFTKSDVTMLLNEGARKEDIAASVLQAVVDQTIGGLACGRKIRGNVAFLGGPLFFLPELRKRFTETLHLTPEQTIHPENAHYFVALGAALLSAKNETMTANELQERIHFVTQQEHGNETDRLPPLFVSREDFDKFLLRHNGLKADRTESTAVYGDLFLGIDAGSTTTKAVLIDDQNRILQTWYGTNEGEPIKAVLRILAEMYEILPSGTTIKNSCVTGYGEMMLRTALGIDEGEVETLAHFRAASHFVPDVSFILDIGGQDIKCLYIKDGRLDKIILNEACSSGCGSFIETFAQSLGYDVATFAIEGLFAAQPIDLGTRCTVFMNSKVKQAQKENATVADISAGISYSVAKNALYKVLKIADVSELGDRIMVQGGTFNNPAVLRAFEKLIGHDVFRTDISGMMGAYGAALIAHDRAANREYKDISLQHIEKNIYFKIYEAAKRKYEDRSSLITPEAMTGFSIHSTQKRCQGCSNKCLISIHQFPEKKIFVSGNKCERGIGKQSTSDHKNLFQYQYERLFDYYEPLSEDKAPFGEIGIPRVLNMYENYPFWFTLFQELGFRVVLSDSSSQRLYNKGIDSISSQTLCFPAKLVHGHIVNLIEKGVKRIFYPALPVERREFQESVYTYNCPVVGSYPEVVRLNIDAIKDNGVTLFSPFLPSEDHHKLAKLLFAELKHLGVKYNDLQRAITCAATEQELYKTDIRQKGEELFISLVESGESGIVLAGRPYHLDPMIHHGIPELIVSGGVAVLSGDSVAHLGRNLLFPLQVVDQWGYHARLYRAATFVATHPQFQMIQLTSFGCGLDAVTAEQVAEILTSADKVHTLIKIDEGTQLGAVKIRVRSLLSTMNNRDNSAQNKTAARDKKSNYTIRATLLSELYS
ncbi:MAG: acyl-CoA dehydratase activase-related protein [Planctomycetaceae bacterium]|jgi:predicted CoA-substrate-specific enzyme activase|nr:acyl-CoA dehydratase activase-related protein [Planctomycetaceae bacterium]